MRRWYRNLDISTLLIWIALCACGLVAIYSSTHGEAQEFLLTTVQNSFGRQRLWLMISTRCARDHSIGANAPIGSNGPVDLPGNHRIFDPGSGDWP